MSHPTQEQVLAALATVTDPERGTGIVALGMVGAVEARDGQILVVIEVDPARGRQAEPIRMAAEAAVRALPGVKGVTVVLSAHAAAPPPVAPPPVAPPGGGGGCGGARGKTPSGPPPPPTLPPSMARVRTVLAVASGKGGVGKSTTAVNLALALAARGLGVGILDADIYGPSIPRLLGITDKPMSEDGETILPLMAWGLKAMSIGFFVPEDTPTIWRGPMVQGALRQMLQDVTWGELDVLVVDLPPGTGDVQLTLVQQVPVSGAVIVSTPQDLALLDARKGLAMFVKVDVPVLGIVENMSSFCCPNCGHHTPIFGEGGAKAEAARLGVDFLGAIPLEMALRQASDAGRPVVATEPDGPHARAYHAIAAQVAQKLF